MTEYSGILKKAWKYLKRQYKRKDDKEFKPENESDI